MPHRWTTADDKRWRKLAHVMRRIVDEAPAVNGDCHAVSLGDLKKAAQLTWTASFPTADKADWPVLRQIHDHAESFADGSADYRVKWKPVFAERLQRLEAILQIPAPGFPAPGAPAQASARRFETAPKPWYLRDSD